MDMDFATSCPLVRPTPLDIRFLFVRPRVRFHASFRRSLSVPPLRFARASPPSGCTGDSHPQDAGHARHTGRGPRPAPPSAVLRILDRQLDQRIVAAVPSMAYSALRGVSSGDEALATGGYALEPGRMEPRTARSVVYRMVAARGAYQLPRYEIRPSPGRPRDATGANA